MNRTPRSPFSTRFAQSAALLVWLCGGATVALAQPTINANGVVNAFTATSPIVAGGVAAIYGANLGPAVGVNSNTPLSSISGTSVTVGGYTAWMYYASSGHLNIQVPWEVAGMNSANVVVTTGSGTSNTVSAALAAYAPVLLNEGGNQAFVINPNGNLNSSTNPATPGAIVQIGAADLGPVQQQQTDGANPNGNTTPSNPISVTIGGQPATVISTQLCIPSQLCPSFLISVVVPNVSGAAEPIVVTEGATNSNTLNMNIGATSLSINSGPSFGSFQIGPIQIPLVAAGGTGAGYTWSIASGNLPPGMALRTDGVPSYFPQGVTAGLIGVATTTGLYTFTLQVTDNGTNTATLQNCTIDIISLAITDPNQLSDGLVNSVYSYTLTATGNTGNVTWQVANGNSLPPGLTLNTNTGVISGTPTAAGSYGFSLDAFDSTGNTGRFYNLQVFGVEFATNGDLGTFNQGSAVNLTLLGTGGTAPYTFNVGSLPAGLSLNSSTGAITGTITGNSGSYRFGATITDHNNFSYNRNFVINVVNVPSAPNLSYPFPAEYATVGESRNYTLNINGGRAPYTWSISSGALPTGMRLLTGNQPSGTVLAYSYNLGPDDAVITGVPNVTLAGTVQIYNFTVTVTDSSPTPYVINQPMSIVVTVLDINYPANPVAGLPYSGYIQPFGGTTNTPPVGPVTWTLLDGGFPPGLTLSSSTTLGTGGYVTGTPGATGFFDTFISVVCCSGLDTVERYVGFNVQSPTIPQISISIPNVSITNQEALPDGVLNGSYNYTLNACCTPTGVTFSLGNGSTLPTGLTLNSNGQISGTPTVSGHFNNIQIIATQNGNSSNFGLAVFSIDITPLQVNTPTPYGKVGTAYSTTFSVTSGSSGVVTWTLLVGSQVPPGLNAFAGGSGVISGTPTSTGTFNMNAFVTDTAGNSFHVYFNIQIYAANSFPPPTFNFGNSLGTDALGELQYGLSAGGGNGTYTWAVVNGSLPPGLSLRTDQPFPSYFPAGSQAGLIGVLTTPGTYGFTLSVTSAGQTSYQYCTITVTSLNVMDDYNLPQAYAGVAYSYTFTALNAPNGATFTPTSIPAWLTLASNGTLSGTPPSAGNFNINYQVSYNGASIGRGFNLNVSALRFTSSLMLPNVSYGGSVNTNITAAGGSGSYQFTASGLPGGLTLTQGGQLSGVINQFVGQYSFNVTVTDTSSNSFTKQFSIDQLGDPLELPTINLGALAYNPVMTIGQAQQWNVAVNNGGTAPFNWNVTGLPPGMSFRPASQASSNIAPDNIEIWGTPLSLNNGNPYNVTYTVTDNNLVSASLTYPIYISPMMVDGNDSPPNGTIGVPYSKQLRVLGGTPPYTVTQPDPFQAPLPDGLNYNGNTLLLSGTPLEDGFFNPQFIFQDSANNTFVYLPGFNIATTTSPQITINNNTVLNTALVSSSYNFTFNACCSTSGLYTWSVPGNNLPTGLTLGANGQLSGTPTVTGKSQFLVKVADPSNPTNAGYKQFSLEVTPLQYSNSGVDSNNSFGNLPFGMVGQAYSYQIPVKGATGSLSFNLDAGSYLPPGLTLSGSGLLSGTPSATGQFQFNAAASGSGVYTDGYFNVSIFPANSFPPLTITTGAGLGTYPVGLVEIGLTAVGGTGSYTWSVTGGSLPPGLSLRSDVPSFFSAVQQAGILGIATAPQAGLYNFTLTVTSGTQSKSQAFNMKVVSLTTMENTGFQLPHAFLGTAYSYTLTPLNAGGAVTFTPGNQIPPGMTLSSAGVLAGTPTAAGVYNFTFTLNDTVNTVSLGAQVTVETVQINAPAILTNATQGSFYTYTFTATGGTAPYGWTANGFPGGLTMSPGGTLSGTVTGGPGRYFLNVTATSNNNISYTTAIALVVVGVPPAAPAISPYGNFDDCSYGVSCSRPISVVNGGVPPYNWTVSGLPAGMNYRSGAAVGSNIAQTDVELWGAPQALGTFNIVVRVADSTGLSAMQTYPLHVSPLYFDGSTSLPLGTLGTAYSDTMRILGGTPAAASPLYGATAPALELPLGLTLSGLTVSGTPQENGNYSPQFTFTDSANPQNYLRYTDYFSIGNSGTNTITESEYSDLDTGSTNDIIGYYPIGASVNFQLGASGSSPLTWTVLSGTLPTGITLTSSGLLTGTISAGDAVGPYSFLVQVTGSGSNTGAQQYTIYVSSFGSSISTNLPYGVFNQAYNQQLPLSNSVTGTLSLAPGYYFPPGLSLNVVGGVTYLTGTPTSIGQYNFILKIVNNANSSDIYIANYNLSIWMNYPPLFLGTGPTLGPSTFGGDSIQLTATGGVPPYTYSLSPNATIPPNFRVQNGGQLPTGFSYPTAPITTGGLIGAIDQVGIFNTSLRVTDSVNNIFDRPVTLTTTNLTILNSSAPPAAYKNVAYSYTFPGYGGTGTYTWSATGLPAGLSLGSATGILSGTPTASGSFAITVHITDTANTSLSFNYTLTVYPFVFTTSQTLPNGAVGQSYSQQLLAPGCGTGCTWSIVGGFGLPSGLTLNTSTGVISGTPTGYFYNWFTVQAHGSNGTTQEEVELFVPSPTPIPVYLTSNPNPASSVVGNGAELSVAAQGGTPPYTWSVTAGSLPPGMSLQGPGVNVGFQLGPQQTYIYGRPMAPGTYNFTLQGTDSLGASATQAYTWAITPLNFNFATFPFNGTAGTYGATPIPVSVPTYGIPYSQPIEVIGGTGSFTSWTTPLATYPLPPGLNVNQSTGVVSGTPTATGSFSTLFSVVDTAGNTLQQYATFNIVSGTAATLNMGIGPNIGSYASGESGNFNLNPSGGTGPYTFTAVTALPPGCVLQTGDQLNSNSDGSYDLACAPTATGTFNFTLQVNDSAGNKAMRPLSITFVPLDFVNNQDLSNGSVGTVYSEQLITFDNVGPVTWSVAPGSALPPGMSLNGSALTGTPTAAGNYTFTVLATDTATGSSVSYTLSYTVSAITIANPTIIPVQGTMGKPYSYQFTATGGGVTKTWSADGLPSGLSMSVGGLLSGTPTAGGYFVFDVTVTDGVSPQSLPFQIFIYTPQLLSFNPSQSQLTDAVVGATCIYQFQPYGSTAPYSWALASGSLPAGLSLISGSVLPPDAAGDTFLAGQPTTAGQYSFTLTLTDGAGGTVQVPFTLNVTPVGIQPGSFPSATINVGYQAQVQAVGGTPPYSFSFSPSQINGQVLPPGIGLNHSTGLFAGTPTSTGYYQFNVTVTDSASHTYTFPEAIGVTNANGLQVTTAQPVIMPVGVGNGISLSTSGGSTYTWTNTVGNLPPGMVLNASGSIVGAPSAPGNYAFTIRATDQNNSLNFADSQMVFQVSPMQLNFARGEPPPVGHGRYTLQLPALHGGRHAALYLRAFDTLPAARGPEHQFLGADFRNADAGRQLRYLRQGHGLQRQHRVGHR